MPEIRHVQQGLFPRAKSIENIAQKIFLTKVLTNKIKCIIFRFVKGGNPGDQVRKHLWGSGIQTPSYILSPLDHGPQKHFLECPFLFLLSFLSRAFGNTAGRESNRRRFLFTINNHTSAYDVIGKTT